MTLPKERTSEIELIHRRISQAKELKNKLKKISSKLELDYNKGLISYWEYQNQLNEQLSGESEKYWLNYYDSYIKNLENKLPKEYTVNNRLLIFSIFLIMSIGILMFNNYTGFTVKTDNNETIIKEIILYTTDSQAYVGELLLGENEVSDNPINLANIPICNYLKIRNPSNLDNIEGIKIAFVVEKSRVNSCGLTKDNIILYEYLHNKWRAAFTEFKNEDDEHYYYSSKVNSISEFAIGAAVAGENINLVQIKPRLVKGTSSYLSLIKDNKLLVFYFLILLSIQGLLILAPGLIRNHYKKILNHKGLLVIVLLVLFFVIYYISKLFFGWGVTGAVIGSTINNNTVTGIIALMLVFNLIYFFMRISVIEKNKE